MMKKKFPDMSGDGKVTKKDVLMAKGVIGKKATKAQPSKLKKSDMAAPMKENQNYMTRSQYGSGKMTKKK
jgi:hypothetical protein